MIAVKSRLSTSLIMLIASIFMIIVGVALTASILFAVIGIPMVIIGVILMISSIVSFFAGTLGRALSLFKKGARISLKRQENEKSKIIDVHKEGGIYK